MVTGAGRTLWRQPVHRWWDLLLLSPSMHCSTPTESAGISFSPASKWVSSGALFTSLTRWVCVLRTTLFHVRLFFMLGSNSAGLYSTYTIGTKLGCAWLAFCCEGVVFKFHVHSRDVLGFSFFCTFAILAVNESTEEWEPLNDEEAKSNSHARATISLSPSAEWGQFGILNTNITEASVPALNKRIVERILERISLHCF